MLQYWIICVFCLNIFVVEKKKVKAPSNACQPKTKSFISFCFCFYCVPFHSFCPFRSHIAVFADLFFFHLFAVEEKKVKTLNNILSAKNKIRYEISELNERLKQSKEAIQKFREEITKLDGDVDIKMETWNAETVSGSDKMETWVSFLHLIWYWNSLHISLTHRLFQYQIRWRHESHRLFQYWIRWRHETHRLFQYRIRWRHETHKLFQYRIRWRHETRKLFQYQTRIRLFQYRVSWSQYIYEEMETWDT